MHGIITPSTLNPLTGPMTGCPGKSIECRYSVNTRVTVEAAGRALIP